MLPFNSPLPLPLSPAYEDAFGPGNAFEFPGLFTANDREALCAMSEEDLVALDIKEDRGTMRKMTSRRRRDAKIKNFAKQKRADRLGPDAPQESASVEAALQAEAGLNAKRRGSVHGGAEIRRGSNIGDFFGPSSLTKMSLTDVNIFATHSS